MSARGVVAAGHPLTAEAGAAVLREGGNAVDAAVAAVMTSCVTESPLTGLGAGGYMLVHTRRRDHGARLLRRRARAPSGLERSAELVPDPGPLHRRSRRRCSTSAPPPAASPGRRPGSSARWSCSAPCRWPSSRPRRRALARDGVEVNRRAGLLPRDPGADPHPLRGGRARSTRPEGRLLGDGDTLPLPRARRRARAARRRGLGAVLPRRGRARGSPTGWSSAAARSGAPTSPPTSRSRASRSRRASAAARCSPTRRRPRAAS